MITTTTHLPDRWEAQAHRIQRHLNFVRASGEHNPGPFREIAVLRKCAKELRAALAVDAGDPTEVFRILTEEK